MILVHFYNLYILVKHKHNCYFWIFLILIIIFFFYDCQFISNIKCHQFLLSFLLLVLYIQYCISILLINTFFSFIILILYYHWSYFVILHFLAFVTQICIVFIGFDVFATYVNIDNHNKIISICLINIILFFKEGHHMHKWV